MNLSQKVAFNTLLLTVSRLAVAASGLVGVIVATRYLEVEDFGQLLTAVTFVALFGLLTDVGLWTVAAREIARRPHEEDRILGNVFALGIGLSVLAMAATLGVGFLLYADDGHELVRSGLLILVLQMAFTAPWGTTTAYMTAHQRAVPATVGGLLASLAFLAALGVVVAADLGFTGLAIAYLLSGVVNNLVPVFFAIKRFSLRVRFDREMSRQLMRWALPQGLVLAIGVLYLRIDTVLLSLLGGNREVALYGVGYRVVEVLALIPTYAMVTLFPDIARCQPHSPRLRLLMQGALSSLTLLVVPVLVVFVAFAPEVVEVIAGRDFADAAPTLRILTVAVVASFVSTAYIHALVALDQQGPLAKALLFILVFNVALNALLIPGLEAEGAALALLVTDVALLLVTRALFARVGAVPRVQKPARLALAALPAVGVALILDAVADPTQRPVLTLAAAGLGTTVVFGAAAHALRAVPIEVTSALAQLRNRP